MHLRCTPCCAASLWVSREIPFGLGAHHKPPGPAPPAAADYVFGERKFGGNAQAITKDRWLHHTSFLWDFRDDRMRLLKQPGRAPEYRAVRTAGTGCWH